MEEYYKAMLPAVETVMLPALDTVMDSFWSFVDMFQGTDATAFEVLWKVDNFSFCHLQSGEKVKSPVFSLGKDADCYFELYPRGEGEGSAMDVHLRNSPRHSKPTLLFFSIASARDEGLEGVWEVVKKVRDGFTASLTVKDTELMRQNPDLLTTGDTLAIRCVVKHSKRGCFEPQNIFLRSSFIVKNFSSVLQLKEFNDRPHLEKNRPLPDMKNPKNSKDSFLIYLSFIPNVSEAEVHIVPCTIMHNQLVTCKLLVLDSNHVPLTLSKNVHLFTEKANKEWVSTHAFNVEFFLDNKESYLPKNTLTLMVELTHTYQMCSGEVRYGPKTLDLKYKDPSLIPGSLKSDLRLLLEDNSCRDVHLKIGSESVSVHKSILRARSSVFKAMMDHDTVENTTNTVTIPDMDMETLQHMVNFMYTDTVNDMNSSSAVHLYYAADKYDMGLLKRRCREYLAENMNQSNICDILLLADMHGDDTLKKCVRYFIFSHKSTLVNSEEWKSIEKNYPGLALDVLHDLYCKAVVPNQKMTQKDGEFRETW